ncbi:MAG: formylmethanofuran dehydrogenase subunit B [Candidatus Brockarchaeota archaeon]|nr:formylmethanofuran dehydrogenase subunit B [Candidatus Brockarchaeota archaeon]
MSEERTVRDVACPFCGCCCDDLEVTVANDRIVRVRNACALGRSKFESALEGRVPNPRRNFGNAVEVRFSEAVELSAKILSEARYPLLWGWSCTTSEAQRVGVELAEEVGGVIDSTTSTCHGPGILAVHDVGESSCTLGEVRHRADLVVYWGCNPVHAHPRHMQRYTVLSEGRFRKRRKDRRMVVVDVRRTATARMADEFIQIEPNGDYEALTAIRMCIRGEELEQENVAGVPSGRFEELADEMMSCEFGAMFFGLGLTMSEGKSRNVDAALSLVRELNERTKFVIIPMRGHFNVTGANEVLAWQTGYPFAVDFSQGYPRYNPGETTAVDIAKRGDCDAALVVASDPISNFPIGAARHLASIPLVAIDPHETATTKVANVVFPSAIVGIEAGGTVYRMDGVPIELKKVIEPPKGSFRDEEILSAILKAVRALRRR